MWEGGREGVEWASVFAFAYCGFMNKLGWDFSGSITL